MFRLRFSLLAGGVLCCLTVVALAERRDETGWFDLLARLGSEMPTGADIEVRQVEANAPGYLPFIGSGTGEFAGKTNIDHTGGGSTSTHARRVGRWWYGNSEGYAPGIVTINSYEAGNYLGTVLRWGSQLTSAEWADFVASLDPGNVRIVNNSWIVTSASTSARRALVRADFQTEFYDLIYINAVNNGSGSSVPPGLSSSFNAIVCGLSNENSSAGPTVVEGARAKPDLVAPEAFTSWSAPQVGGAVAMLLEQGAEMGVPESQKPQVIKAILQASAQKPSGWEKGDPGPEDDVIHPLDWHQGAGEVQVDRNYDTMAGGMFLANTGAKLKRRGWSYDTIALNEVNDYLIHVATKSSKVYVGLAWHRHHTGNFFVDGTWPLNNVALEVWESNAAGDPITLVQESRSLEDNIQLIVATGQGVGIYLIRLIGLTDNNPGIEDYGLAWWTDGIIEPGDMNGDATLDGADIDPFFLALGNPEEFMEQFPGVEPELWGDVNADGSFDGADIDAFFELLGGP